MIISFLPFKMEYISFHGETSRLLFAGGVVYRQQEERGMTEPLSLVKVIQLAAF